MCESAVFLPAVGTICDQGYLLRTFFRRLQMLLKKFAVTVVVLFILVIRYDGSCFPNGFGYIRCIAPVLFSSLFTECGIRVCRILEDVRSHSVFLCLQADAAIFPDCLLRKHADKELVLGDIVITALTGRKKPVCIIQDFLQSFRITAAALVVDDTVVIGRIVVMFQSFQHVTKSDRQV